MPTIHPPNIFSEIKKEYLTTLLDEWVKTMLEIEETSPYSSPPVETIKELFLLQTYINEGLEKHIKYTQEDKKLKHYFEFFNITLKHKTKPIIENNEDQIKIANTPQLELDFEIANTTYHLINELYSNKTNNKDIKSLAFRYFFYSSLYSAFLHDESEKTLYFLRFKWNKKVFEEIKKQILKNPEKFISDYDKQLINFYNTNQEKIEKLYKKIIQEDLYFEPLTYHLVYVLYGFNHHTPTNHEKTKKFIHRFLSKSQEVYEKGKINNLEFYELEKGFALETFYADISLDAVGKVFR